MARPFARLETPDGSYMMSKRELDQLRLLLLSREALDVTPNADPPVHEQEYDQLADFIGDAVKADGYLD